MPSVNSGYHDCPCPTCFEIAIGTIGTEDEPAMCHACDAAGCDGASECQCEPEIDPDGDSMAHMRRDPGE